jgi:hypothetical protein
LVGRAVVGPGSNCTTDRSNGPIEKAKARR